jgi:shikimate kinase
MSLRDTLVIPPVVLIGPVSVGKSTIAGLLADRMGWPHVSMDAVCAGYYAEISADQAVSERPKQAADVRAAYQSWKPLEAYAVERILADHQHAVIDLGGGHSVRRTRPCSLGCGPPWRMSATSPCCCQALTQRSPCGS